jgi:hypothetical protein
MWSFWLVGFLRVSIQSGNATDIGMSMVYGGLNPRLISPFAAQTSPPQREIYRLFLPSSICLCVV